MTKGAKSGGKLGSWRTLGSLFFPFPPLLTRRTLIFGYLRRLFFFFRAIGVARAVFPIAKKAFPWPLLWDRAYGVLVCEVP